MASGSSGGKGFSHTLRLVALLAGIFSCDGGVAIGKPGGASSESIAKQRGTRATGPARTVVRPLEGAKFVRTRHDVLEYELLPSYSGNYTWAPFETNKWGMRDKEYAHSRPPQTYRIALLGSNYSMAAGVPENESFQAIAENMLNSRSRPGGPASKYEILNFGVAGYSLLENVVVLERRVWEFQPNAVLLALETPESSRLAGRLVILTKDSIAIPYSDVANFVAQAGASPAMSDLELAARLEKVGPVVRWSLGQLAEACRKHRVLALAVVLPAISAEGRDMGALNRASDRARAAGFTVLQIDDVFEGHPRDSIQLQRGMAPNSLGHRLIADAIVRELRKANGAFTFARSQAPHSSGASGTKQE